MRRVGVLTKTEDPSADELNDAYDMLNDLLDSLSNDSMTVYARTLESFPVSGAINYTIGTGGDFNTSRPVKIIAAFFRMDGTDYKLELINDTNYAGISQKSTTGIPVFLNFTNEYPLATIRLFPAPSSGGQLFLLTEKPLSQFTVDQDLNFPPGWRRMLINNLAIELAPEYGQQVPPELLSVAMESKAQIRAAVMRAKSMQWNSGVSASDNVYTGWNT
jgi:hypothetical protein